MKKAFIYKKFLFTTLLVLSVSLINAQTPEGFQNKNTAAIATILPCELNNSETEITPGETQNTLLSATGIAEIQASNIKAYIFNRTLFVQLNKGEVSTGELKLYSLRGMELYSKLLNEPNHKIDLSTFNQGIYVLKIQNGETIISKKIIID
jgi:hypothetical protein